MYQLHNFCLTISKKRNDQLQMQKILFINKVYRKKPIKTAYILEILKINVNAVYLQ